MSFTFDLFHRLENKPSSYVVDASEYGVAQSRNRVFLLGVRTDLKQQPSLLEKAEKRYTVHDLIGDLPELRSGLSRDDSVSAWLEAIKRIPDSEWFLELESNQDIEQLPYIRSLAESVKSPKAGRGARFVKHRRVPKALRDWYHDPRLGGACNHESRSHMASDLHRYFFMAAETERRERLHRKGASEFANVDLGDFPRGLLPDHKNVTKKGDSKIVFKDRFKVQRNGAPSSTVVSHLRNDGHYFIHPDPAQCRSLTVREAARLQSFPDNYFFEGSRGDGYLQVGNAVPPYLAKQIAGVISDLFERNRL